MASRFVQLAVLMLLAIWPPAHAADAAPVLLVVGDSLSAGHGIDPGQGWVALLQKRLEAGGYGYRVVNASISGDTTTGGLARLPRALALHRPAIVFIELGGNDGLRATPATVVRDNLSAMARLALEAGARVVLAGMEMPPNYGPRYTAEFAAIYPAVAKALDTALVPFFLDKVALDAALMQGDGIHPNAAAQPRLLDNAWPAIEQAMRSAASSPGGRRPGNTGAATR